MPVPSSCPPPPPTLTESALPFFVFTFLVTSLWVLLRRDLIRGEPTGHCGACKYDLAGLPDFARCPECNSDLRETANDLPELHLIRERVPSYLFAVAVIAVAVWLGLAIPTELLVHIYKSEGFSEATARHAIPIRELRNGAGQLLAPILIAAGFLPLLTLIKSRRWSCFLIALTMAAAVAYSFLSFDSGT